jgi:nucleotide-binding universal stress UspA family protein
MLDSTVPGNRPALVENMATIAEEQQNSALLGGKVSLRNVLFVTDFSPSSELALPYSIAMAGTYGGKVYLAHVVAPEMWEFVPPEGVAGVVRSISDYARRRMDKLVSTSDFGDVPHEALIQEGEIWDTLHAMVDQHAIDVIAGGVGGHEGLQEVLMGSVANKIIRLAHRPVLSVGARNREKQTRHWPENILLANDFSLNCAGAIDCAVSLAGKSKGRITSVYVAASQPEDPQTSTRVEQFFCQRLQEYLPLEPGFPGHLDFRVEFGLPTESILKVVSDCDVDLIIMGARGAGSILRTTPHFGTTAFEVVSQACCPVLTVR